MNSISVTDRHTQGTNDCITKRFIILCSIVNRAHVTLAICVQAHRLTAPTEQKSALPVHLKTHKWATVSFQL